MRGVVAMRACDKRTDFGALFVTADYDSTVHHTWVEWFIAPAHSSEGHSYNTIQSTLGRS